MSKGTLGPAPCNFVVTKPLSEPESLAIYNFTSKNNFKLVIALHSQGKEIYWNYQNINPPKGYEIGKKFSEISNYLLTDVPFNSSFAGFKDWFIDTYNKPGYTIEVGLGSNPLPISQFNQIYNDILGILILGAILA